jgi:membrane protein implicated in regulation of membrane protease activity
MSGRKLTSIVSGVFFAISSIACAKQAPPPAAKASTAPAGNPAAAASADPAPQGITVSGTVVETMDAAGYTYLRIKTASGETWAAVNQAAIKKGDEVKVVRGMTMEAFESKTLNRKFDSIVFGSLDQGGNAPAAAPAVPAEAPMAVGHAPGAEAPDVKAMMAAQHAAASKAPVPAGEAIKVPKAEGADGKTIAEIYASKASLKNAKVSVRGKVVKFNGGIMGKNWIHLRDGSGSPEKGDFDLTVTSTEAVAVGDVVLVKGTVQLDRDFGSGYSYPVLVEGAAFSK